MLLNQGEVGKEIQIIPTVLEQSWLRDGEYLVGPQPTSAAQ